MVRSIGPENLNEILESEDIVIFDTRGDRNTTITKKAWYVFEETNHCQEIQGHQDKEPGQVCLIVNAVIKATIPGREMSVLMVINYAILIEDPAEHKSLVVPFEMMRHGIKYDLTPRNLGGKGCMLVEEECLNFGWDEEKLYISITKPNEKDMEELECFELNSPLPLETRIPIPYPRETADGIDIDETELPNEKYNRKNKKKLKKGRKKPKRNKKKILPADIPMSEWTNRLACLPEDVIHKTLENTTHMYLQVKAERRQDPQKHYKSRFPGLRLPRQNESVASDTFFPSVKSDRGNTCSQFFRGINSDRWEVYSLKKKIANGIALQDYEKEE